MCAVAVTARTGPVTDRTEQDTRDGLSRGMSVTRIARGWVVSPATVLSHVRGILTKLGAPSQLAAVSRTVDVGWFVERTRITPT